MRLLSASVAWVAACLLAQASGDSVRDHRDHRDRASLRQTTQQQLTTEHKDAAHVRVSANARVQAPVSPDNTFLFFGDKAKARSFCQAAFVRSWWVGNDENNMWLPAGMLDTTKGIPDPTSDCTDLVYKGDRPAEDVDKDYCAVAAWEDKSVGAGASTWRTAPVVLSTMRKETNTPKYAATRLYSVLCRGGQRWGQEDASAGTGIAIGVLASEWPNRVDKTTFGNFYGWSPNDLDNRYELDTSKVPAELKKVLDAALPAIWPRRGARPNSRGHLIANMLSDRRLIVGTTSAHFISPEISGATFFAANIAPTFQPFDSDIWGGFETSTTLLVDRCWYHNPDAKFYYIAGPSIDLYGYVGNEVVSSGDAPASLSHMVGWPKALWGVIVADIPHLTTGAIRTVAFAIKCENRFTVANPSVYGNTHPCEYKSVDDLQAQNIIDFDPVPGLTDVAARTNADPDELLPRVDEVSNFASLNERCKANMLPTDQRLFGLHSTARHSVFKTNFS